VDGVLAPPLLGFDGDGEALKLFHVRDGHRIRLALRHGLGVGVVSGRASAALAKRCADLGLAPVLMGIDDKVPVVERELLRLGLAWSQVAVIGDDLPDLGLLERAGLAIAVADAEPCIRRRAHWVTRAPGAGGAVAEAIARLLRMRGIPLVAGGLPSA
jgi:3-deoxy-D-manno-octulosonate 8-phosphate phosphatase (KDO 8-P phosphatase)